MPMARTSKDVIKLSKRAKRQTTSFSPGQGKMLCFWEKIWTPLRFSHQLWVEKRYGSSHLCVFNHSQKSHQTLAVTKKNNKTKTEDVILLLYKTVVYQTVLVSPNQERGLREGTEKGNSNDSEDRAAALQRETKKDGTLPRGQYDQSL